jgi:CARDB
MSSNDTEGLVRRLGRIIAVVGVVAVSLVGATSAWAVDDDPPDNPPPTTVRPNLLFSAVSVAPFGTSQWEIRYTVANRGTSKALPFHVAVQENGGGLIKETAYLALDPGASRSEIIHVNRTGCYFAVRFVADSTRAVLETSETDNQRVALAMTSPACSQLPKYKVKAVSFHVVDESGVDLAGSDEPYFDTSGVGVQGTPRTTASHVFGNIDTGDTAFFGLTEGCIYLSCSGGAAPFGIGISIQLWEHDNGDAAEVLRDVSAGFAKAGALSALLPAPPWVGTATPIIAGVLNAIASLAEDDLLGTQTYAYSPLFLATKLPAVGSSFTDVRRLEGGSVILGGVYDLTTVVTRVA